MDKTSKILITGGTGLVGHALVDELRHHGFDNLVVLGSADCDLRQGLAVEKLFAETSPDYVFHLAARVHGIGGNAKYKSDILYENVMINTHVIEQARRSNVKKIVAMGSGCVYPELKGQQELFESQIWDGPPHGSEDSYAHSKRLMLAQLNAAQAQYGLEFAYAISGNLYGPFDNFNSEDGHVVPSLVTKFHDAVRQAKPVQVWGSGIAIRDFSHASDAASALWHVMRASSGPINIGSGHRHAIREIVDILDAHLGSKVAISWDKSKPDGQLVRYYNLDKLFGTGFSPRIALTEGVKQTYDWFQENHPSARLK